MDYAVNARESDNQQLPCRQGKLRDHGPQTVRTRPRNVRIDTETTRNNDAGHSLTRPPCQHRSNIS
jgi:hypothetical protein